MTALPTAWRCAGLAWLVLAGCGPTTATPPDDGSQEDVALPDSATLEETRDTTRDTEALEDLTAPPDTVEPADAPLPTDTDPDQDQDGAPLTDAAGDADTEAPASCEPDAPCEPSFPLAPCSEGRCDQDGECRAAPIAGCCQSAADCLGLPLDGPCSTYRCAASECTPALLPGCCVTDAECDDGVGCTDDRCGPDTGTCTHCPTGCVCAPPLLTASFDGDALATLGFSVNDPALGDGVTWRPSTRRFVRPPGSAYLGRDDCPTYYNGTLDAACAPLNPLVEDATRVVLELNSPGFVLPAELPAPLATVWIWADVEPPLGLGDAEPDVLRVLLVPLDGDDPVELGSSLAVGKTTAGGWRLLAFDLTPWRGRAVRLRFDFDTYDGQHNFYEGVYLDDLRVAAGCEAGGCCTTDADCAGGDPAMCTTARCVSLTGGAGRLCAEVPQNPGAACAPCSSDAECADGDPCTLDRCGPHGQCTHAAFCCFRQTYFTSAFDGGLEDWSADPPTPGTDVAWRSTPWAFDGSGSAWFGDPATGTYDAGVAVQGRLTSPPFTLPSPSATAGGLEVAFALALSTEWDDATHYDNPAGVDLLTLSVLTAQHEVVIWSSDAVAGTTTGEWVPVVVPLDVFAGRTIQLRFAFDSVDDAANDHSGAHVDALEVRTTCP